MASQDPGSSEDTSSADSNHSSPSRKAVPDSEHSLNETTSDSEVVAVSTAISQERATQKRKRVPSETHRQARAKRSRLKGQYVDAYRVLYNQEVATASRRFTAVSSADLLRDNVWQSQIGSTVWTAYEKNIFFNALAKLGKDDAKNITAAIGTKSEIEVQQYLFLLKDARLEHVLNDERYALAGMADLDAAVELSEECCMSMDLAGEALAWYQDTYEAKIEIEKHGDHWLMTRNVAERIEDELKTSGMEEGDYETTDDPSRRTESTSDVTSQSSNLLSSIPAAKLLNLKNWLKVSEDIFMNSDRSDNWHSIADPGEEPSIYHTAFHDFHRLAVSVTKRLMQASLFQATCRLRAGDYRTSHRAKPRVSSGDVHSAIEFLGLKRDSKDFWAKAARRNRVRVYKTRPHVSEMSNTEDPLDYDEVDRIMSSQQNEVSVPDRTPQPNRDPEESGSESGHRDSTEDDEDAVLSDAEQTTSDDSSEVLSSVESNAGDKQQRQLDSAEDDRAGRVDLKRSREEELKMWDILEYNPPRSLDTSPDDSSPEPKKRPNVRPGLQDLSDWRDWTTYVPPWKELGPMISKDAHQPSMEVAAERAEDLPSRFKTPSKANEPTARGVPQKAKKLPSKPTRTTSRTSGANGPTKDNGKAHKRQPSVEYGEEDQDDEEQEELASGDTAPRVLPSRNARHRASSQIKGTEYWPGNISSEDDFDPHE